MKNKTTALNLLVLALAMATSVAGYSRKNDPNIDSKIGAYEGHEQARAFHPESVDAKLYCPSMAKVDRPALKVDKPVGWVVRVDRLNISKADRPAVKVDNPDGWVVRLDRLNISKMDRPAVKVDNPVGWVVRLDRLNISKADRPAVKVDNPVGWVVRLDRLNISKADRPAVKVDQADEATRYRDYASDYDHGRENRIALGERNYKHKETLRFIIEGRA